MLEVLGDRARADVDGPGYGQVGPAPGGHPEDLEFAIGQVRQAIGFGRHGRHRVAPPAGSPQGVAHRQHDRVQQRGIGRAELRLRPAQRDADRPAVLPARQGERDLVIGRDVAEVLAVDAELPEPLTADHIADPDGPADAGSQPLVLHQRVLVHMGLKDREGFRVQAACRIFGVLAEPIRLGSHFLVCSDITADQAGEAGQEKVRCSVRLVQICEAVHELRCSVQ
ncbi:MAG TPA: hypothetical protein VMC03_19155 [Streptosporangiaceae bacterium]|nr:hypothetical protein [Streptosporangiaceae bacterium]